MSDTFTLDVAQATEIKHAAVRAGATNADIKALTSGDMFARILPVLRGRPLVDMCLDRRGFPFSVWKTIKLGTGFRTVDDVRQSLESGGHKVDDFGRSVLIESVPKMAKREIEVDLVCTSAYMLGFEHGAEWVDIVVEASSLGLKLCSAEVGPQLRLQYRDQPRHDDIKIMMKPILCEPYIGDLHHLVFDVSNDGAISWLSGQITNLDTFLRGRDQLVFVRPRK